MKTPREKLRESLAQNAEWVRSWPASVREAVAFNWGFAVRDAAAAELRRRREQDAPVTHEDFLRDPKSVVQRVIEQGTVVVTENGKPVMIISVPTDSGEDGDDT